MFPVGPVVTNARAFYTTRAAAGALSARHFLRPPRFGAEVFFKTRAKVRRENAEARVTSPAPLRGRSGWGAPKREPCFVDPSPHPSPLFRPETRWTGVRRHRGHFRFAVEGPDVDGCNIWVSEDGIEDAVAVWLAGRRPTCRGRLWGL